MLSEVVQDLVYDIGSESPQMLHLVYIATLALQSYNNLVCTSLRLVPCTLWLTYLINANNIIVSSMHSHKTSIDVMYGLSHCVKCDNNSYYFKSNSKMLGKYGNVVNRFP